MSRAFSYAFVSHTFLCIRSVVLLSKGRYHRSETKWEGREDAFPERNVYESEGPNRSQSRRVVFNFCVLLGMEEKM